MKLIVISLSRAEGRRAKIQQRLDSLRFPFSFLDATDGKQLSDFERSFVDDQERRRLTEFPLTDGEIGCWHSHRRVMRDIAENGPDLVAVIEDDAKPTTDFVKV